MWQKSKVQIVNVTLIICPDKKKINDVKFEKYAEVLFDINETKGSAMVSIEEDDKVIDLSSGKEVVVPKRIKLGSFSKNYIIKYCEDKIEKSKYKFHDNSNFFFEKFSAEEIYQSGRLVARCRKKNGEYRCQIFKRGERLDNSIMISNSSIKKIKEEAESIAKDFGWKLKGV